MSRFKPYGGPATVMKISETLVSRMLARHFGVAASETVEQVFEDYAGSDQAHFQLLRLTNLVRGLYPWETDVASDVFNHATNSLMEHVIPRPGDVFVAKDKVRSGIDSLWFVTADPFPDIIDVIRRMPCRSLLRTLKIEGTLTTMLAIQINSIQPYANE